MLTCVRLESHHFLLTLQTQQWVQLKIAGSGSVDDNQVTLWLVRTQKYGEGLLRTGKANMDKAALLEGGTSVRKEWRLATQPVCCSQTTEPAVKLLLYN